MKLGFEDARAEFQSASQTARVDTENWASRYMFCPNCGNSRLSQFEANRPVADISCSVCGNEFELKSQSKPFGNKIANGAYETKLKRLSADNSPNLILLHYDRVRRVVVNLHVVPKCFFVRSVIERRKPLASTARRAGWVGSNIVLSRIPLSGRVRVVNEGEIRPRKHVLDDWQQTAFVATKTGDARGWLVDVMHCIEKQDKQVFTLSDLYGFEGELSCMYPQNNNIRPKIRQQLQVLRDNGYLQFLGDGRYSLL
ncbi:MAG: DpnI domain-containing protein [Pseudomonadota bacterium]